MSNRNKLLVSIDAVKQNTVIESNVTSDTMRPIMLIAQEYLLQPQIGESFFNFLLLNVNADGTYGNSITGNTILNTFIEDFMVPYLYQAIMNEFLVSNVFHLTNVGLIATQGSNSEPADKESISQFKSDVENRLNYYAQRMRNYMYNPDNYSTFSSYLTAANQNINPQRNRDRHGIWVPPTRYWSNWHKRDI